MKCYGFFLSLVLLVSIQLIGSEGITESGEEYIWYKFLSGETKSIRTKKYKLFDDCEYFLIEDMVNSLEDNRDQKVMTIVCHGENLLSEECGYGVMVVNNKKFVLCRFIQSQAQIHVVNTKRKS